MATEYSTSTPDTPEADNSNVDPLPKLNAAEFRHYNYFASHMDQFHTSFWHQWTTLHACTLSPSSLISLGLRFVQHLEMHHGIEEAHIFPRLAERMPAFQKQRELVEQHKVIHEGLDKVKKYLAECRDGEREFDKQELRERMDTFGETLRSHMDDEVKALGAEEMRKYWTVDEVRGFMF
ncbi:hypothetical protein K440DRAFT_610061 [Wilcoxina mikolae CBS 423.85]|nr:hypothetical protein K440DRAFT_610061 [Wilcoxina mikolae CBS 423.85]